MSCVKRLGLGRRETPLSRTCRSMPSAVHPATDAGVHQRIDDLYVKVSERMGLMEKFLAQKYDEARPQPPST
jgi:hypothetical protein